MFDNGKEAVGLALAQMLGYATYKDLRPLGGKPKGARREKKPDT